MLSRPFLPRPPAHSYADTFVLCFTLGIARGFLSWLFPAALTLFLSNLPPWVWLSGFLGILPVALVYGGLQGAFWALFAMPILRRTPLKTAAFTLSVIVAFISIGSALLGAFKPQVLTGPFAYMLSIGPTAILVITCLLLRHVLPDVGPTCPSCGNPTDENRSGVCSSCGDTSVFRRRSRYVQMLAFSGIAAATSIAVLFAITHSRTCGYWGQSTVVVVSQGALVINFNPLTYEGWIWGTFTFIPMPGYVFWPIFTEKTILLPLWIFFVPSAIASVLGWRHGKRAPLGYCQRCGYNLAGLTSDRCPECGHGLSTPDDIECNN